MQTKGKFILFSTDEFAMWLNSASVTRLIKLVQIHHTWLPDYASFNKNYFALLESMEASHLERGFAEIAQNLTIFPDGMVAICRSFNTIPAGIKGANSYGICIESVGNFDIGKDQISDANRLAYIQVVALLCNKFKLAPDTNSIVYHHWYDLNTGERTNGTGTTKTCPGSNFMGGNTVEACQNNFVPPVKAMLDAGITSVWPAFGEVNASMLNVRAEPSSTASVVRQISYKTVVCMYEMKNSWYRINIGEWVYGDYITLLKATGTPVA